MDKKMLPTKHNPPVARIIPAAAAPLSLHLVGPRARGLPLLGLRLVFRVGLRSPVPVRTAGPQALETGDAGGGGQGLGCHELAAGASVGGESICGGICDNGGYGGGPGIG